jgi:putative heme-binding domain-containing protein
LHIIDGGDYGYRYRNGRKGLHPFTAWDGELPGTLPMAAGTAEAPSGILVYEGCGLPKEYRGQALVTSWGDHVLERFTLIARGASFRGQGTVLARGGEDFRPVGIAAAPDGSVVLSDWVDKSYPVHGKGRLWRIRWKNAPPIDNRTTDVGRKSPDELRKLLAHPRVEIRTAATEALAARAAKNVVASALRKEPSVRGRLHALWAAARLTDADAKDLLLSALDDKAPEVRGEAAHLLGVQMRQWREAHLEDRLLALATKDSSPFVRRQALGQLWAPFSLVEVVPLLADADPFLAGTALALLGQPGNTARLLLWTKDKDPKLRLGVLLALRRAGDEQGRSAIGKFLADADPAVRRAAIQWVGEERLTAFRASLHAAAASPPATRELLEAYLASEGLLAGTATFATESAGQELVARIVADPKQPVAFRALGLRMLRPDHPTLKVSLLGQFLQQEDSALRREAQRALVLRADDGAQDLLRRLAVDGKTMPALRADAVMGLAQSAAGSKETRKILLELLGRSELLCDVPRSLRPAAEMPEVQGALLSWWDRRNNQTNQNSQIAEEVWLAWRNSKSPAVVERLPQLARVAGPRPSTTAAWREALARPGDPAAGERVFFHPSGPRCYACHQIDGRGAAIGPDLSAIGRALSRDKLIESILEPSKEIAPRFTTYQVVTRAGKTLVGMIVSENFDSTLTLADADGKLHVLHRLDVAERVALPRSLMPDNLTELMTRQEFRDLLAFLQSRK